MQKFLTLGLFLTGSLCAVQSQALDLFSVASGDLRGGYHAAVSAICDQVNRRHGAQMRCSPESTPGSRYNIAALRDDQVDFALVQSDWHRLAYEGLGPFENAGPQENLRSVLGLFAEDVTILARKDAGISEFSELTGKRLDIGHPASGRYATNKRMLDFFDLQPEIFEALFELPVGQALDELCAGRIDATILIVGNPNPGVESTLAECDAMLVPIEGEQIDALMLESKDFQKTVIPSWDYPQLTENVPSFAVIATIVTRADIDEDIVETLVTETLNELPAIKQTVPIMARVTPETLQTNGLSAPLHKGAVAAFEKAEALQ